MRVFVICTLILMLVPVVAQADTLLYLGENGLDKAEDWYTGSNANSNLWDYVYQINPLGMGTAGWGIVCPVVPVNIYATAGWTATYYAAIPETVGTQVSEIWHQPGIVWLRGDGASSAGIFHFQTDLAYSPVIQSYDGDSWTGKTEYSANPEPGSLALLGCVIAGGALWRRRRTALASGTVR